MYAMLKWLFFKIVAFSFFQFTFSVHSKIINDFIAVVGDRGITRIDLEEKIIFMKKNSKSIPKDKNLLENKATDILIDQTIISIAAEQESIVVSKERIDNQIDKEMKARGFKSLEKFKRTITKIFKMSWEEYRKSLKERIIAEQLAQLKIKFSPPTDKEISQWYAKNKNQQIGDRFKYRLIVIPFKAGNTQDEIRANKLIIKAKKMAKNDFAKAARKYSKHPSAKKGGLVGWKRIDEIAIFDRYLAGLISQTKIGQVSPEIVIKGAYYIVKVESRKQVRLQEVENQIKAILTREKQNRAFEKWLVRERSRLGVKIFLENYKQSTY